MNTKEDKDNCKRHKCIYKNRHVNRLLPDGKYGILIFVDKQFFCKQFFKNKISLNKGSNNPRNIPRTRQYSFVFITLRENMINTSLLRKVS